MTTFKINTRINSKYQVFDLSGRLPFDVLFGLCRRSPADTDARAISLGISKSVLDIPYALTDGLLTLFERSGDGSTRAIDIKATSLVGATLCSASSLTLPSPVGKGEQSRDAYEIYAHRVEPDGDLASILEPGKTYEIRLTGEDLGFKSWEYVDDQQIPAEGTPESQSARLVNSKPSAGHARFTVVKSLQEPPNLETRLQLHVARSNNAQDISYLEARTTNKSAEKVSFQIHGHHQFIVPWGLSQPELGWIDDRSRILDTDASIKPPTSSLLLVRADSGEIVKDGRQQGTGALTDSRVSKRPLVEWVITLSPGDSTRRKIDLDKYVIGVEDGRYKLSIQARGCWWCSGEVSADAEGRVPKEAYTTTILPAMLESSDVLELTVRGGRVVVE